MKLHSNFSDYYDGCLAYGIDETIHYVRKQSEIPFKEIPKVIISGQAFPRIRDSKRKFGRYSYSYHGSFTIHNIPYKAFCVDVYFCGKLYKAIQVESEVHHLVEPFYFWRFDQAVSFFENLGYVLEDKHHLLEIAMSNPSWIGEEATNWLIDNKITVASIAWNDIDREKDYKFIVNPVLKDMQFYTVVDAWTAFQEISMWIGGVLSENKMPPVALTEKERLNKHGMDKWSFRKMKEAK